MWILILLNIITTFYVSYSTHDQNMKLVLFTISKSLIKFLPRVEYHLTAFVWAVVILDDQTNSYLLADIFLVSLIRHHGRAHFAPALSTNPFVTNTYTWVNLNTGYIATCFEFIRDCWGEKYGKQASICFPCISQKEHLPSWFHGSRKKIREKNMNEGNKSKINKRWRNRKTGT